MTRMEINNDVDINDSEDFQGNTFNRTEYIKHMSVIRGELKREISEKLELENKVKLLITELEQKMPLVTKLSERSSSLEVELTNGKLLLEHTSNDNLKKTGEISRQNGYISDLSRQIDVLKIQRRHLANQVWYLLICGEIQGDRNTTLNTTERKYLENILQSDSERVELNDSALVISNNFVKFKNVTELQQQNMKLLTTVDAMSSRAEELEQLNEQLKSDSNGHIIQEAREVILDLESRNNELENKVALLGSGKPNQLLLTDGSSGLNSSSIDDSIQVKEIENKYQSELETLQKELQTTINSSQSEIEKLRQELLEFKNKNSDLQSNLMQEKNNSDFIQQQVSLLQNSIDTVKIENRQLSMRNSHLGETITKYDTKITNSLSAFAKCKAELSANNAILKNLKSELVLVSKARDSYKNDNKRLSNEKSDAIISLSKSENLMNEVENLSKFRDTRYNETITNLNSRISELTERMSFKDNELKDILLKRNQEFQWYKDALAASKAKNDTAHVEINGLKVEIEKQLGSINTLERSVNDKEARINFYKAQNFSEEETIRKKRLQEDLHSVRMSLQQSNLDLEMYKSKTSDLQNAIESSRLAHEKGSQEKQTQIELLQKSLDEITVENDTIKKDIEQIKTASTLQINSLQQNSTKLQDAVNDFEKNTDLYEEKISDLNKQIEQEKVRADDSVKELNQSTSQVSELKKKLANLNEELIKQSAQHGALTTQSREANIKFEETSSKLINERDTFQNKSIELERQVTELKVQLETLESSGATSVDRTILNVEKDSIITSLKEKNSNLRSELSSIQESEIAGKDVVAKLQVELDSVMVELNDLKTKQSSQQNTQDKNINSAAASQQQSAESATSIEDLNFRISDYQQTIIGLQTQLDEAMLLNAQKDNQLQLLEAENETIKNATSRDSPADIDMTDASEGSLDRDATDSKELMKQNQELEDELDRLKQETSEKLSDSKHSSVTLLEELEHLKQEKHALEEKLVDEEAKVTSLEERMTGIGNEESNVVTDLQNELENSKIHSKEIEAMLNATMETSNKLTEKLSTEIANLKSELEETKIAEFNAPLTNDDTDEYNRIVENMRKSFDEEKVNYIQQKEEEYNSKIHELEERLQALSKESENVPDATTGEVTPPDMETLKKEWMDQYEGIVLQRIENAEESLKKRIRLPTEEKINNIVEKHKNELDKSFQAHVDEKARELITTSEFEGVLADIKSKINTELKASFEGTLKETQKKSFEEGQRQAMMKTTLLQRKISSLENQLQEAQQRASSVEEQEVGNNTELTVDNEPHPDDEGKSPDKQAVPSNSSFARLTASPFEFGNSPFSSQDSGLFKNSAAPQPSTIERNNIKANPFSTSFGSSPTKLAANPSNPFGKYKPTFSLNSNITKDGADASESVADSTIGSKRSAEDDDSSDSSETKRSKGGIS